MSTISLSLTFREPEPELLTQRRLREIAEDQYGYVTTRDAAALGVPTAKRVRKKQPRADIEIVLRDVAAQDRTQYFGIPATKVARALLDARTRVMPTRLRGAAAEAYRQGLMLRDEYDHVLAELEGA